VIKIVDGKKKGGGYEREKARQLSLWFTKDKNDDVFWRTSASGAKATVNLQAGKDVNFNHFGDIGAINTIGFPFIELVNIECKSYQDFSLLKVLKPNKNPSLIENFWGEAKKEADDSGRLPILIMKKNYFPDLIMMSDDILDLFKYKFDTGECIKNDCGSILLLSKFLERVNPEDFVREVNENCL
jgi:hypothetical protein